MIRELKLLHRHRWLSLIAFVIPATLHAQSPDAHTDDDEMCALTVRHSLASGRTVHKEQKAELQIHHDTTCGDCHDWILTQFRPLWENATSRTVLEASYNISFWGHTVTRHSQVFTLNLALDCASKHFAFPDFVEMLFTWESTVEPWTESKDPFSGKSTFTEKYVDETSLLEKSVPSRLGWNGIEVIRQCMQGESEDIISWVRENTPASFEEVPMIVVDGVPSKAAAESFKEFLRSRGDL
mmetsp:Transcript_147523/g.268983  ORF Transcript_147523/g.268983 Transcript_147523/m.268983 type:complete len:240 (+) Transcript_147523:32-751(+)